MLEEAAAAAGGALRELAQQQPDFPEVEHYSQQHRAVQYVQLYSQLMGQG